MSSNSSAETSPSTEFTSIDPRLPQSVARHMTYLQDVTDTVKQVENNELFRIGGPLVDGAIELCSELRRVLADEIMLLDARDAMAFGQIRFIYDAPFQRMRRLSAAALGAEESEYLATALSDFSLDWDRAEKIRAYAILRLYRQAFEISAAPSAIGIADPSLLRSYIEFLLEAPHFRQPGDRARYRHHLERTIEFLQGFIASPAPAALRSVVAQTAIDNFSVLLALCEGETSLPLSRARIELVAQLSKLSGIRSAGALHRDRGETLRIGLLTRSLWPTRSNRLLLPAAEAARRFGAEVVLITVDEAHSYSHDVSFSQRMFAAVGSIVRLGGQPQNIRNTLEGLSLDALVLATDRGQTDAGALDFALCNGPVAKVQLALGAGLPGAAVPFATHFITNSLEPTTTMEGTSIPICVAEPIVPDPRIPPDMPLPILDAVDFGVNPENGFVLTIIEEWQTCADQVAIWEAILTELPAVQLMIVDTGVWRAKPGSYRIPLSMRLAQMISDDSLQERMVVSPLRRNFPRQVQHLLRQADIYIEPVFFGQNSALADAVACACIPAVLAQDDQFGAAKISFLRKVGIEGCVFATQREFVAAVGAFMRNSGYRTALKSKLEDRWEEIGPNLSGDFGDAFYRVLPSLFPGDNPDLAEEVA